MQKQHKTKRNIVILTDALSVLKSLQNPRKEDNNDLLKALKDLYSSRKKVVLQWIPAHCNVKGNEKADQVAKEGGKKDQCDLSLSYSENKTELKQGYRKKWKEEHPKHDEGDCCYQLTRREQVLIFRLRTGHNRQKHHLFTEFRIGESDICICNQEPMTAEHILGRCSSFADLRKETWPEGARIHDQLYADLQQLRRTTDFIIKSGLTV
ncbi:uncharacterized protein LOC135498689 [Lineus longissimus]|uniref:uncharacterized protein LOC135498689 n=1 Tax=Lineus longissimus TaxID=88925 RepID=UPI00315C989B